MTKTEIKNMELLGYKFKNDEYTNHHNGDWEDDWKMWSIRLKDWISMCYSPEEKNMEYFLTEEKKYICNKIVDNTCKVKNFLVDELMKLDHDQLLAGYKTIVIQPTIELTSL